MNKFNISESLIDDRIIRTIEYKGVSLKYENITGYYNIDELCYSKNYNISTLVNESWFNELTDKILEELSDDDEMDFNDVSLKINNELYIHEYYILPIVEYIDKPNSIKYKCIMDFNKKTIIENLTIPINRNLPFRIAFYNIGNDLFKIQIRTDRLSQSSTSNEFTLTYINGDDVLNIFYEIIHKYNKLDCIERVDQNVYKIYDFDKLKQLFDDIKCNNFVYEHYGINEKRSDHEEIKQKFKNKYGNRQIAYLLLNQVKDQRFFEEFVKDTYSLDLNFIEKVEYEEKNEESKEQEKNSQKEIENTITF